MCVPLFLGINEDARNLQRIAAMTWCGRKDIFLWYRLLLLGLPFSLASFSGNSINCRQKNKPVTLKNTQPEPTCCASVPIQLKSWRQGAPNSSFVTFFCKTTTSFKFAFCMFSILVWYHWVSSCRWCLESDDIWCSLNVLVIWNHTDDYPPNTDTFYKNVEIIARVHIPRKFHLWDI